MSNQIVFVTNFRTHITKLLSEIIELNGLKAQYNYEDLGNTLSSSVFDTDLHKDITLAQFIAGVGSFDSVITLLSQGHGTNISRLRNS